MEVFQKWQKDASVKHIFWIPCVAHVMDLILEDIGDFEWVATRIAQARVVTKFFKRHSHAREVLQTFTTMALLLPTETRFGPHVIMMRRLLQLQVHLMQVVTDDRWKNTVWSTKKIRDDAAEVTACVGCPRLWQDMKAVCKLLDPIMDMLQMVDNDTRQIGKILRRYNEMIMHCLSACAAFDKQDAVLEVFDRCCTMFKSPAHVAAMMLDPEFRERTMLEVTRAEKLVQCHWNLRLLVRHAMSDDAPNDKAHPYGSWVHYWQQVEDEVPTDKQLVSGRGTRAMVTQEELMQIPVSKDSFSDDVDEERIEQDDGSGHARNDTQNMHATTSTGSSASIPESQQGRGPLMRHPEIKGDTGDLPIKQDEGSAAALHPLTSAGGPTVSATVTSNVRRPPAAAEQESMLPPHSCHGVQLDVRREVVAMQQSDTHGPDADDTVSWPPPALMEGTVVECTGADLPEGEVSHTPAPEQSAAGHVGLACPTDSRPGAGELSAMDSTLVSLPDLSTLISPGRPHVSPPNPHQPVAIERGPDAFDEFGGDTITVCPTVSATPTVFRVCRPHEVDLAKAKTTMRHLRDGHRNIAQRSLSDSFDGAEDGGFAAPH
ncbi:hypothetical protein CBR_g34071 [Chara braunii]|uniref:DUF659 domain-containing protein n=1 Tax=Chara braunii TaxID=69332 RepID=A0A388LHZ0_CHABU|nr:hypothetical protein CBR_g34071 [Chara braunii]|eukprot:GBG81887.1 hypothetical protein CBR_g34071 [Chara braunii]